MSYLKKARSYICVLFLFVSNGLIAQGSSVTLSKAFNPSTIGPGSTSRLVFTFNNIDTVGVTDIAVTDALPASVTIATPANVVSSCLGANVTAPGGGGVISISDVSLGVSEICTVAVNVTSSTIGIHMNTTGSVTSSGITGAPASAELTVVTTLPGFSKSFSPSTVSLGAPSTLTFTIDNTLNASIVGNLDFIDNLPTGMIVASPANSSTNCISAGAPNTTITAISGSNQIILDANGANFNGFEVLPAGANCTVSVNIISGSVGLEVNQSENLLADFVEAGFAVDSLNVTIQPVILSKDFIDDPIVPGGTGVLRFTILNTDRNNPTTGMTFTDDLDAVLTGLVAVGLPQSNVCGAGSSVSGSGLISFTGGTLPAEGMCSFDVTVQVPLGAAPGQSTNTTSSLTGGLNGSGFTSDPAVSILFVEPSPILTKEFTDDPVGAGGTVNLEFTVTNTGSTVATDINFFDNLTAFLPSPISVSLPSVPNPPCGAGSTVTVASPSFGVEGLMLTGGSLAAAGMAGDSCIFSVDIDIPSGFPNGIYTNTTEIITATVGGVNYNGLPATDDLVVVAAPQLQKEFLDNPVLSGDTITLQFTLSHDEFAPGDASSITFTDDLNATLTGLSATGLPQMDICGLGSSLSGTTNLTFTGGLLAPGETCTFSVTMDVPASALSGLYTNITSAVTANVLGVNADANPASDILNIANIAFSKEYLDDPVIPGDTTMLRFTIDNSANTQDATDLFFTDNLNGSLTGLTATGMPSVDTCGGTFSGTTFIIYLGGNLLAGESCIIEVELLVPLSASSGDYTNTTSSLTATIDMNTLSLPPASDDLIVSSDVLLFSKEFIDDPVAPGNNVVLEFTIENIDPINTVTNVSFNDDFDATLTGLIFTAPVSNGCGGMAAGVGTGLMAYVGGTLGPSSSCTIQVLLTVPAMATSSINTNVTSVVTGMVGALPVNGNTATDDLLIDLVTFTKSFDGPTTASGTPVLTYTISNLDASNPVSDLSFTDDLDAVISGLVATGLPISNSCGAGSTIAGTSFLTFSGGTVPASGMCQFSVDLAVPASATAGNYPSSSSDLTIFGLSVAPPSSADLIVEPAPLFAKSFAPNAIGLNQSSSLMFTIDNSASALAASSLDFTDNFPNGIIYNLATPVINTCGGTANANNVFGASSVTLTGGTVSAGTTCTIQVSVGGSVVGAHVNTTGDLTSSSGNSGTASDTLVVNPQPGFSKSFTPGPVFIGGISTLTFTIDNSASTVVTTALNFTDNLPTGLVVATPSNASTTCAGGTLTAASTSSSISYVSGSMTAGSTCIVSVDIQANSAGSLINVSGDLTSSLGNSGSATDTIVVNAPPTFVKVFNPNVIIPNDDSTLTFNIDNSTSTVMATGLDFTDNLPAGIIVAPITNLFNSCSGGSITAVPSSSVISYTGGSLNSGATCFISVDVTSSTVGNHMNLTGDLTSNHGNSGPAMASLLVTNTPVFSKAFATSNDVINNPNTLTFTLDNSINNILIGSIMFADNMPSGFFVANPANATHNCTTGLVTANVASSTISFSSGSIAANATCNISVDVIATIPGQYTNTTSVLVTELGNGNVATADITISSVPLFAKSFAPNIISPGGISTLSFDIDNSANVIDTDNFAFIDNFPAGISIAPNPNVSNTCVSASIAAVAGSSTISVTNGSVTASSTCQISVDITSSTSGFYTNITGDFTSDAGNSGTATADLNVTGGLMFAKSYSDYVTPGGTVTLSFLIENNTNTNANNISFSDNLSAVIIANATNLPLNDVCGVGSQVVGVSGGLVQFTGGMLNVGESCQVDLIVQIDASVLPGVYTNTTSPLSADFNLNTIVTGPASADFTVVSAPVLSKSFNSVTITGGDSVDLTFSIANNSPVEATQVSFSDDLDAFITGATALNLPQNDVCGMGSSLTGTSTILLQNGVIPANSSCQFTVTITIPTSTSSNVYTNVTSASSANYDGFSVTGNNLTVANATLLVNGFVYLVPLLDNWKTLTLMLLLMLWVANVYYFRPKKLN